MLTATQQLQASIRRGSMASKGTPKVLPSAGAVDALSDISAPSAALGLGQPEASTPTPRAAIGQVHEAPVDPVKTPGKIFSARERLASHVRAANLTTTESAPPEAEVPAAKPKLALAPSIVAVSQQVGAPVEPQILPLAAKAKDAVKPAKDLLAQQARVQEAQHQQGQADRQVKKEMASMRSLTRLLEAIFSRPGNDAPETQRIADLSRLAKQAQVVAADLVRQTGGDPDDPYLFAQAMDAVVSLVSRAWESGDTIDIGRLIETASATPEIFAAAQAMAHSSYRPVSNVSTAVDRLNISIHNSFWRVYGLGAKVDGVTAELAAHIVRDSAAYLQSRGRPMISNDLHVAWLQGSLSRITDLVCAEVTARGTRGQALTAAVAEDVLRIARTGFEGVENYAQSLLESPAADSPGVVDKP